MNKIEEFFPHNFEIVIIGTPLRNTTFQNLLLLERNLLKGDNTNSGNIT